MEMVTGMTRDQPSCEDALATRNRQYANVAATIDECVEVEGVLQENMLQQHHFRRYDHDYEIPHPPQNPESIPCSCFVVAQLEQGMAANHDEEEVSVENEMASQEISSSASERRLSVTEEDGGIRPVSYTHLTLPTKA